MRHSFTLAMMGFMAATYLPQAAWAGQGAVVEHHGVWSLLPALLAIGMALMTRQVLPSLFLGVFAGSWLLLGASVSTLGEGFLRVVDTHLLRALVPEDGSTDHMAIILFTLLTGGMIGIIARNGGLAAIVAWVARFATSARRGQMAAYMAGLVVFFDDYANTLIVGNTMRPLMDRLKISREKLAWIVDSTAAPIATIALMTTWIGFQVSLLDNARAGIPSLAEISGYEMMVQAIPYSFYSLFSIIFIAMVIVMRRDFGPMLQAEQMAASGDSQTEDAPASDAAEASCPWNALIPIMVLVGVVIGGLLHTGQQGLAAGASLTDILGNADPFKAMLWASLSGVLAAVLLSYFRSPLKMEGVFHAFEKGLNPMLSAAVILTLAWAIAGVNESLGTAVYLTELLVDGLNPHLLPALVFILAFAIAFATGTSWGVMAILVPLVVPLTAAALDLASLPEVTSQAIFYAAIASTLTGAVWGDHCSPISDTTILSSIASGCDHISHVRTQLPYAMLVGAVSLIAGLLPIGYGLPWWGGLLLGVVLLWSVLRLFGRVAEA